MHFFAYVFGPNAAETFKEPMVDLCTYMFSCFRASLLREWFRDGWYINGSGIEHTISMNYVIQVYCPAVSL